MQRIGVVLDGGGRYGNMLLQAARRELTAFAGKGRVVFPAGKTLRGDFTSATAARNLSTLLADAEVDVVWAFGVLAADAAARRKVLRKPVLAPFVIDERLQGIERGKTLHNLSYVLWSLNIDRDMKTLSDLASPKHVAYVVSRHISRELPALANYIQREASNAGVKVTMVLADGSAAAVLAALPADADAVYLGPNPRMSQAELGKLAQGLIAKKLPSFSKLGRSQVERGILAGLGSPADFATLARVIALNTDAIMRGEKPSSLTTAFKMEERLVLNMGTARAIGLSLSWDILAEADLINATRSDIKRKLTLASTVREVLTSNLDLRANVEGLSAVEEGITIARARLLPRLEATLTGSWIDAERASAAFPERQLAWGMSLRQSAFDESLWAGLSIQHHLYRATAHSNEAARLNAVQAAVQAYLNVLITKTSEKIQRDNLTTTRANLALARVRVKVGRGKRSEVVRLESLMANTRTSLVKAVAQRNIAEMELNRLLNRPIEEPFEVAEVTIEDSRLLSGGLRLQRYMDSPKRFKRMRSFMVAQALINAPELKTLDARIAAKGREYNSNALKPYLPTIGLSASVTHRFLAGGAGADPAISNGPDKFDLQLGLSASLPLYEGNARYGRIRRAAAEKRQLERQRDGSRQIIEQNVRRTLHQAGATFRAITLTRRAADLARENLALVQAAYGQGKATIVELLDAQNQAVVGQFAATTAVYSFLVDLMAVQRATGRFEFAMNREDVAVFFQQLDAHVNGPRRER